MLSVISQALYAVGNFKASEDSPPRLVKPQVRPPQKDALRALTQRGHDSVYQKGHTSESNDELVMAPPHVAGLNRKVRREKASMGSLKRASADVELLAPRSPMAKETMLTFSNTLPRASANAAEEPAQRHMTFHVGHGSIFQHISIIHYRKNICFEKKTYIKTFLCTILKYCAK